MKTYKELIKLSTFEERFKYLKLDSKVSEETFGSFRYLNQKLYHSDLWKSFKRKIIIRDKGCDLGVYDFIIPEGITIIVHHINPLTIDDVIHMSKNIFDENNVITTTLNTHNAIHYSNSIDYLMNITNDRLPNDTCPWKK